MTPYYLASNVYDSHRCLHGTDVPLRVNFLLKICLGMSLRYKYLLLPKPQELIHV